MDEVKEVTALVLIMFCTFESEIWHTFYSRELSEDVERKTSEKTVLHSC